MAKRVKGEVSFEHGGKSWTLALDFNALAEFEDLAGVPNALQALDSGLGAKAMRALFCAALRSHHPDISLIEAGQMLLPHAAKLNEALTAAFPKAEVGNAQAKA